MAHRELHVIAVEHRQILLLRVVGIHRVGAAAEDGPTVGRFHHQFGLEEPGLVFGLALPLAVDQKKSDSPVIRRLALRPRRRTAHQPLHIDFGLGRRLWSPDLRPAPLFQGNGRGGAAPLGALPEALESAFLFALFLLFALFQGVMAPAGGDLNGLGRSVHREGEADGRGEHTHPHLGGPPLHAALLVAGAARAFQRAVGGFGGQPLVAVQIVHGQGALALGRQQPDDIAPTHIALVDQLCGSIGRAEQVRGDQLVQALAQGVGGDGGWGGYTHRQFPVRVGGGKVQWR